MDRFFFHFFFSIRLAFNASRRSAICSVGCTLVCGHRHYRSQPTHGIGRYRHLLPPESLKKKKERLQMKEIDPGTEHEYGALNIVMTGYDMTLVEHYAQYVHKLCNRLSVKVEESYAMPTKTTEVMLVQEQGSKMKVDAVLTTHQRVVQVRKGQAHSQRGGLGVQTTPEIFQVKKNKPGLLMNVNWLTKSPCQVYEKQKLESLQNSKHKFGLFTLSLFIYVFIYLLRLYPTLLTPKGTQSGLQIK
uniref:Small ribosomal subunit protein uS10 domain-containing protein n=1 Tax=Anolis carolinensis TaxID=28377 RepID=H9GBB8_ANOCA